MGYYEVGLLLTYYIPCPRYKSKVHNHIPKLAAVVSGLARLSLSPEKIVIISLRAGAQVSREGWNENWVEWENIILQGKAETERDPSLSEIKFWRGGFDHPLWILFSSGTTGKPNSTISTYTTDLTWSDKREA